jgi:hypothetical protein
MYSACGNGLVLSLMCGGGSNPMRRSGSQMWVQWGCSSAYHLVDESFLRRKMNRVCRWCRTHLTTSPGPYGGFTKTT